MTLVPRGASLTLSAEDGAVIYYTTDDTCPCQNSAGRQTYTEPVVITKNTRFRIVAYREGMAYSERLNITVTVADEKKFPFSDIPKIVGNWKYDNVKYVYDNGIMNGISGTDLFEPDGKLNRAMFATVLYRMAGQPSVAFRNKFTDVKDGQYYSSAVIWGNAQGIVDGFNDGSYGVKTNIIREQIAKMLYEYASVRGYDVRGASSQDSFTDKEKVSGWAEGYMKWAVYAGMISGKPNGDGSFRLDPKGEATRAECAKMLTMFLKKYR